MKKTSSAVTLPRTVPIIDAMQQPPEARAFAAALEEACHQRVCPDGNHYIRGYFDTDADAILTAYALGFIAGRKVTAHRPKLRRLKEARR
jgi:hypothetical protein